MEERRSNARKMHASYSRVASVTHLSGMARQGPLEGGHPIQRREEEDSVSGGRTRVPEREQHV